MKMHDSSFLCALTDRMSTLVQGPPPCLIPSLLLPVQCILLHRSTQDQSDNLQKASAVMVEPDRPSFSAGEHLTQ